ncbi:MAG: hypothetical protein ACJ78Q_18395 [Chloroflexia bacterium]
MVTRTMVNDAVSDHAESTSYERFAGWCAMGAAVAGLIYSLAFVVLKEPWLYGLAQLVGGLLTTAVLVAVYSRLRAIDQNFALWGLLLGLAGALGSAIHGGFDLANALNPPKADVLGDANVPFLVDPRGLLTFGVASIGTLIIAWLMTRGTFFPKSLGYLGYLLAALLMIIYVGRLVVLDATSLAILIPAALAGFIVNPAWYAWLGWTLTRKTDSKT